jgi:uncharacterized protein
MAEAPNWDEWWEPVRYHHSIGEIDVPVLHISGWYDDEEIGTPANFARMVYLRLTKHRQL